MQNFVKALTVSLLIKLFFFICSIPLTANEFTKFNFDEGYCYNFSDFYECIYNDGSKRIGNRDEGGWNKNVKFVSNGRSSYYFYRSGEIAYGVISYNGARYVGDLSSNGDVYGFGTYYFDNGDQWSFQNWHDEKKIGYFKPLDGKKIAGRFDSDYNLIINLTLDSDFQLKLNNYLMLARSIEVDFNREYKNFSIQKREYLSSLNQTKEWSSSNNIANNSNTSSSQKNTNAFTDSEQNLIVGLAVLFIFIVFLWISAKPSKITKSNPDTTSHHEKENTKRYKNFSIADSRKLFSYGVENYMSTKEACRQLRSEYFRWTTVSNNPDILKKNLSKKNLDNIIKLREKLKC